MRGDASIRKFKLINYLTSPYGKTLAEMNEYLAEEGHPVHTRTIRRDLTELELSGMYLVKEKREAGEVVYRIQGEKKIQTQFNAREVAALIFSLKKVQALAISPFAVDLETAIQKLLAQAPANLTRLARQLDYAFEARETQIKSYDLPEAESRLIALTDAIHQQLGVHLAYRNAHGDTKSYDVWPVKLMQFRGSLYVYVCRPGRPDKPFVVALDRIQHLTRNEDDRYTADDQVRAMHAIEAIRERAFGLVDDGAPVRYRLTIAARLADYIRERQWHGTQRIETLPEGRIALTFTATGANEVEAWIRYLGEDVLEVERTPMKAE